MTKIRDGLYTPMSGSTNKKELDILLDQKYKPNFFRFCWHKWVYWRFAEIVNGEFKDDSFFNGSTKPHRVCNKCYKKQQLGQQHHYDDDGGDSIFASWIKDVYY